MYLIISFIIYNYISMREVEIAYIIQIKIIKKVLNCLVRIQIEN